MSWRSFDWFTIFIYLQNIDLSKYGKYIQKIIEIVYFTIQKV